MSESLTGHLLQVGEPAQRSVLNSGVSPIFVFSFGGCRSSGETEETETIEQTAPAGTKWGIEQGETSNVLL